MPKGPRLPEVGIEGSGSLNPVSLDNREGKGIDVGPDFVVSLS
jgi:hypothetical protein